MENIFVEGKRERKFKKKNSENTKDFNTRKKSKTNSKIPLSVRKFVQHGHAAEAESSLGQRKQGQDCKDDPRHSDGFLLVSW